MEYEEEYCAKQIRKTNRDLYDIIAPIISSMPDLRSDQSRRLMKTEKFKPWVRVYNELDAMIYLYQNGDIGDLKLFEAILANDRSGFETAISSSSRDFESSYPAITWIIHEIAKYETYIPFLLHIGRYDLFKNDMFVKEDDLQYIAKDFPNEDFVKRHSKVKKTRTVFDLTEKHKNVIIWAIRFQKTLDLSEDDNYILYYAIVNQMTDVVRLLLQDKRIKAIDKPSFGKKDFIQIAVKYGNLEILRMLLQDDRVTSSVEKFSKALSIAIKEHNNEAAKLLLRDPRVDPSWQDNEAMFHVFFANNVEGMEILLQDGRIDPTARNNEMVLLCVRKDNEEILNILLKDGRANPSANNNQALVAACRIMIPNIVEVLLNDSRVNNLDDIAMAINAIPKYDESKRQAILSIFSQNEKTAHLVFDK